MDPQPSQRPAVLFIGKRFYTNRDALTERFGRIYQLPFHWAQSGPGADLWLIDYYTRESGRHVDDALTVTFTPVRKPSMASRGLSECAKLFRPGKRYKIVVASGDCYIGLLGLVIARLTRALFVFDVYDKYDEFETYRRIGPFDPLRFLLSRSDVVTFASHALEKEVGWRCRRTFVVPNGIDTGAFHEMDKHASRQTLGLSPAPALVGYFGGMETFRGVDDLIAAVEIVRQTRPDVEMVLAGRANPKLDLDRSWIHYLGDLPFDRIPTALAACDVLAIPYRRSAFLDMASSCKIAEYLAARRPIVATRTPNLVENFPEQARQLDTLLAAPGNVSELADSILRQLAEPRLTSMPDTMEWSSIAARTIEFVQKSLASCAIGASS
jgi:glycosyltransferase involved in cell wall biosynthesis